MVQRGELQEIHGTASGPTFGVGSAEDDPGQATVYDGTRAHGAGFLGDVENAIGESPVARGFLGLSERQHLGVGGGVIEQFDLIPSARNDAAVLNDDGTHGHFLGLISAHGQTQGFAHEVLVALEVYVNIFTG